MLHPASLSVLAFALLAESGLAHAKGTNPAAAETLFEQGRAALAKGDFESACGRFRESDRLDPALGTRFNLADCEERRGRLATAWSLFRAVIAQLGDDDDRLRVAQHRLADLEPRVPRLTMVLAPNAPRTTRVQDGDIEYAESSFGVALPLDPGMHRLMVRAPGHRARRLDVALESGEMAEVSVAPGAALPSGAQAFLPADQRSLGYVLAGVGATGLLFGVVSGVLALHQKSVHDDNCDVSQNVCNQTGKDADAAGHALSVISVFGFAAGIAASAAGTYLILTSNAAHATALSGTLSPATAFFSLRQTF